MSLSADAALLTRGRDPHVIAAALLLDEILAGELDVERGCVDGEPVAAWIDRMSRIAPPRIIAGLVRDGLATPRRFSLSTDARAEAAARARATSDAVLGALVGAGPLPPATHTLPPAVQEVLGVRWRMCGASDVVQPASASGRPRQLMRASGT